MKNNKFKFWLDLGMVILLSLMYNPHSTGMAIHEWMGIVLGTVILVHLFGNRKWITGISKKVFSKDLKKGQGLVIFKI